MSRVLKSKESFLGIVVVILLLAGAFTFCTGGPEKAAASDTAVVNQTIPLEYIAPPVRVPQSCPEVRDAD